MKKEIKALRLDKEKLKLALNDFEQYERYECIEISGVPLQDGENTEDIALAIGKEIGVEVGQQDITACHRLRKVKEDPIIIVKVLNRKKKEEVMANRKTLKTKTLGSLILTEDVSTKNGKVFLNGSLTRMNRDLFRLAHLRCSEVGWKCAWTKTGVISVRRNGNTAPLRIANLKDLEQKVI